MERLSVLNNPVCVSERSLRSYVVKLLPKLKYYNDVVISNEERNSSGLVVVSEFLSSILADSDIGSGSLHLKSSEVRTGRRSIEWSESQYQNLLESRRGIQKQQLNLNYSVPHYLQQHHYNISVLVIVSQRKSAGTSQKHRLDCSVQTGVPIRQNPVKLKKSNARKKTMLE